MSRIEPKQVRRVVQLDFHCCPINVLWFNCWLVRLSGISSFCQCYRLLEFRVFPLLCLNFYEKRTNVSNMYIFNSSWVIKGPARSHTSKWEQLRVWKPAENSRPLRLGWTSCLEVTIRMLIKLKPNQYYQNTVLCSHLVLAVLFA